MSVHLGDRVQDKISGFEGIATGRTEYLNGCVSILVEGAVEKEGKLPTAWFDAQRIVVVKMDAFVAEPSDATAGGSTYIEAPIHPAT